MYESALVYWTWTRRKNQELVSRVSTLRNEHVVYGSDLYWPTTPNSSVCEKSSTVSKV